jgi:tripartite-type tricarboxylate transporter receptor subunit TctC
MVSGTSPIRSIEEFIAASKAAPDRLSIANEGPRTLGGMAARLFNARAGIRNNLVPYASASVGIQDALGGRVDAIVVDLASTTQHIKRGDLRLLATTSARRLKAWDATPALSETLAGFDMPGWFAVVAPAGTPKAVVVRVNRDINSALAEPELVERISAIGPIVDPGKSPEQTADFLRHEHQQWRTIANEIGLLPE